ncbi:MAG: hypothetical protein NXI20_17205 [bacterium]|nr:hypothetical protein [bacterium]
MKALLKAKHWQLFLLTYGIPIFLQIVFMASMFSSFAMNPNEPPEFFTYGGGVIFGLLIIMAILSNGILLAWMWTVATRLQNYLPEDVNMKIGRFKVFFVIPFAYIVLFVLGIGVLFLTIDSGFKPNSPFYLFFLIIPLHLFAMFCIFHNIYFIAKTIKSVELQREAKVEEYLGEFFLVWFYLIGVWILQPKINKWVEEYEPDQRF